MYVAYGDKFVFFVRDRSSLKVNKYNFRKQPLLRHPNQLILLLSTIVCVPGLSHYHKPTCPQTSYLINDTKSHNQETYKEFFSYSVKPSVYSMPKQRITISSESHTNNGRTNPNSQMLTFRQLEKYNEF